jgi:hypothetical protein
MADNVTLPGTGAPVATDEVSIGGSTVHAQRIKLGFGAEGAYDGDVSTALPLPVQAPQSANMVEGHPAALTDSSAHDVIAAQGEGIKIYAKLLVVTNSHATVGTLVTLQDDAGSPKVLARIYCAAGGGGAVVRFPDECMPYTGANQKLQAICGTTGSSVYVDVYGVKGA